MKTLLVTLLLIFSSSVLADGLLEWEPTPTVGNITYNVYIKGVKVAEGLTVLEYPTGAQDGLMSVTAVNTAADGSTAESEPISLVRPAPPSLINIIFQFIANLFN